MNTIIEDMIMNKPHLEGVLRFYENALRFADAVKALGMPSMPGQHAYPPEFIGLIVERFQSVFDMPAGSLAPLKQALELGEIDFTRLPLLEVPAFSLPYPEDDLMTLLFLISRPFFHAMHEGAGRNDPFEKEGRCPVCSARPSVSSVTRDGLQVRYCSFCGTKGRYDRPGCPVCQNEDAALLNVFVNKKERGFSIRTCSACKSYVKTVDGELLDGLTPDVADLISLPLDVVIQKQGFKRTSPNPVGMVRMSEGG